MKQCKISIIMPNYNGEKYIAKAINSFISNAYTEKELIIIDAKSTDRSHEIIAKAMTECAQIKWVKQQDQGISDAINIGLEYVTGDIIGYLGSDDLLNANTLEIVGNYKSLVDYDGIYFNSYSYYVSESHFKMIKSADKYTFTRKDLIRYGTVVGLQNIFFDRRVFEELRYDVKNRYSMDYEFYFRVLEKYSKFIPVDYSASINIFDNNISGRQDFRQQDEAWQVLKHYITINEWRYLSIRRIWQQTKLRKFLVFAKRKYFKFK